MVSLKQKNLEAIDINASAVLQNVAHGKFPRMDKPISDPTPSPILFDAMIQ
jgi:hypothetical protein